MISFQNLEEQLKRINFRYTGWGRTEVRELCNILMPEEEIEECVNGYYESGFALLVATKDRVLMVDKKPLNNLTVEDMRFDMINELDYGHRIIGAQVKICAGMKTLNFTSWNQVRLRRLLTYVQFRITSIKREQQEYAKAQKAYMEQLNQQLQMYLLMQQHSLNNSLGQAPQAFEEKPNMALPPQSSFGAKLSAITSSYRDRVSGISPAHFVVSSMKKALPVVRSYARRPSEHLRQNDNNLQGYPS